MDIDRIIFLARAVGHTVLNYYGSHVILDVTEFGGDRQRLVDKYAEDTLEEFLDFLDKDVDLLTEGKGYVKRGSRGILVVDPVDGSVNADRGIPMFAVSIALFEDNDLSSLSKAVIYEPTRDVIFYAEKNKGAYVRFRSGEERRLKVPSKPSLEVVYVSIDEKTVDIIRRLMNYGIRIRELGSVALGMAYTAAGRLDAFIDIRGYTRLMDIAAGLLLLKEAGYMVEKTIKEMFPYPKFTIIAAPRSMLTALKVYLESDSEGFRNMFRRVLPVKDDRNTKQ